MTARLTLALLLTFAAPASAGETPHRPDRAWVNYALHCQGCHLPDAMGMEGKVPRMNGFVGNFLHSEEGRHFIIQVPGVSKSPLPDQELSELMNWMLKEYSADQIPSDFVPFTAKEVGSLRQDPVDDPLKRRAEILGDLSKRVSALNCYSDAWVRVDTCE